MAPTASTTRNAFLRHQWIRASITAGVRVRPAGAGVAGALELLHHPPAGSAVRASAVATAAQLVLRQKTRRRGGDRGWLSDLPCRTSSADHGSGTGCPAENSRA